MKYAVLLRGVNVGGKNKISMSVLKSSLEEADFKDVVTLLNSGNVVISHSSSNKKQIAKKIENLLTQNFTFDSELIKVLVLNSDELEAVIKNAPAHFGSQPEKYHNDVVYMIDVDTEEAFKIFNINPEVDSVWKGDGVIYFQRLSEKRTKSKLSRIISTPIYKSMTIRTWNTTVKLLDLLTA